MACFYADGEAFLIDSLALDWVTFNSSGGVASYGIDHPSVTSNEFYIGVAFITGIGGFYFDRFGLVSIHVSSQPLKARASSLTLPCELDRLWIFDQHR
jgi:hypothetical protein